MGLAHSGQQRRWPRGRWGEAGRGDHTGPCQFCLIYTWKSQAGFKLESDVLQLQDSGGQEWRRRGEGMEVGRVEGGKRCWKTTFCYLCAGVGPHFTEQETEAWSGPEGTLVHGVQNSTEAQSQSLASRSSPGAQARQV